MATSAWCESCGLHWSDCSCSRENRNASAETDWTRRVRESGRRQAAELDDKR